jgi:hypothetical protein
MSITLKGKIFDGQTSTQQDVLLNLDDDGTISCQPEMFYLLQLVKRKYQVA